MTQESRLDRLELKVDQLQAQAHTNHLELLSCFRSSIDEVNEDINVIKLEVERHSGYFSSLAKLAGFSSILAGWISLKDVLWPHK